MVESVFSLDFRVFFRLFHMELTVEYVSSQPQDGRRDQLRTDHPPEPNDTDICHRRAVTNGTE